MNRKARTCLTGLALLIYLATLAGCHEQVLNPSLDTQPSYGVKVKYAKGQPIEFPDFTIEFVGEKPPRSYENYPRHEFKITRKAEVQDVSWGRDQGDIGRVKFKVGDNNYLMELVGSQEYGFMGENVLVIWKNPEAA
jgi:hypothetical protein